MNLRIHQFLPRSHANGPGMRAVLWVQGCTLGCPNCFNPETHIGNSGTIVPVEELVAKICSQDQHIEGITISGGEPLQQKAAITEVLRQVRAATSLSVILFSGFTWQEISSGSDSSANFLKHIDVLIAGRYDKSKHLASGLRGSSNKTIHLLTARYTMADLEAVPAAEVMIDRQGEITISGIDPVRF